MNLSALDLVNRLLDLVKKGEIQAVDETSPASNNRFVFTHEGIEFSTEWFQDDKPTLLIAGQEAICDYIVRPLIVELQGRFTKPSPPIDTCQRERENEALRKKLLVQAALRRLKAKE